MVLRNIPNLPSQRNQRLANTGNRAISFRGTDENVTINPDGSATVDAMILVLANQHGNQNPASVHKIQLHIAERDIAYWFVTDDDTHFIWENVTFCSGMGDVKVDPNNDAHENQP